MILLDRKVAFSTTALSLDITSAANPDEYRHKTYIARNHRPWATSLPLTVGYASPSFLKQSGLKTRTSMPMIPSGKQYLTQNGYSRSFKVICFDVDEKPLFDSLTILPRDARRALSSGIAVTSRLSVCDVEVWSYTLT